VRKKQALAVLEPSRPARANFNPFLNFVINVMAIIGGIVSGATDSCQGKNENFLKKLFRSNNSGTFS